MQTLIIDTSYGHAYYSLFYVAAFLASFIILIVEGRKRKLPTLPWLIVIGTGYVFFILGCRIITFSMDDWSLILNNQQLTHATGIVMLGGLLFSVPAILFIKRIVNLNATGLDAYAFVLPVGMFFQRIGCFLNGCCFGSITTSSLGVQYGQHSSAFLHHYQDGSLPVSAITSHSVHPVQLYESLVCLIAVVLLWKVKNRLTANGSLFYLSGLTYYVTRFVTEFFRDGEAQALEPSYWLHLNTIQWVMLVLIAGSCAIIINKEQNSSDAPTSVECPAFSPRHIIYFLILSVIYFYASRWLSLIEILVVYIVLFTTGIYILLALFKSITVPRFRFAFSILILTSFIMMSQTYPEQAASDSTKISYNTISIGGLLGSQNLSLVTEDCDGNKVSETEFKNKYRLAALGFSRTVQTGKAKSISFGLNAYTGVHDENVTGFISSDRPELRSYGFNPFVQLDYRTFAFGTGVHVGDMSFIGEAQDATSVKRYSVYPQVYMRFGNLNRVFGELSWAKNFPSSFPGTYLQANMGFGLKPNSLNSGTIRIGTSSSTGLFFSSTIPAGQNFIIEPYVGFLGSILMKIPEVAGYDENMGVVGSLSLHYKFNKKGRH